MYFTDVSLLSDTPAASSTRDVEAGPPNRTPSAQEYRSTGEDGQPIDGSTVIEQFHVEQSLPRELKSGRVHRLFCDITGISAQDCVFCMALAIAVVRRQTVSIVGGA
jgi:hypothetical protein